MTINTVGFKHIAIFLIITLVSLVSAIVYGLLNEESLGVLEQKYNKDIFVNTSDTPILKGVIVEGNIKASRYDEKVVSTEAPIISYDVRSVCSGDNVLIAEDIFDEGITLQNINARIKLFNPASIKIFSLLFKPQKYQGDIRIHYPLFKIDDHWIVGYGMDLNEKDDKGRNRALLRDLPFIAVTNPDYLLKIGKIGQERADHLKGLIK